MYLLGVKIDNVDMDEVLKKVEIFFTDGRQHHIVTPNPEIIILAQKDKEFEKILNGADLSLPDGIGTIWASKFFGEPLKGRITGVDLTEKLLVPHNLKRIFLLGGRKGAAEKISKKFSNITGFSEKIDEAIKLINELKPNILFVALGAPKQEKWIYYNMAKMPSVKVAIGVGGAFDFISGKTWRAPKFLRRMGLEWFWRLFLQPWRIKRIYNATIKFPYLILLSKLHTNSHK